MSHSVILFMVEKTKQRRTKAVQSYMQVSLHEWKNRHRWQKLPQISMCMTNAYIRHFVILLQGVPYFGN